MSVEKLTALVPAAGFSRRFGSDKRLLLLPDVLTRIDQALPGRLDRIVCVLKTSDKADTSRLIPESLQTKVEPVWLDDRDNTGLGASLAAGSMACKSRDAVLVCLADMPFISTDTLNLVCDQASASRVVAPAYQGKRGHPVCFGRAFFAELALLDGDQGARAILERHNDKVIMLPVKDPGILRDVDTRQQWEQEGRDT